jgi:hypothetical protein
VNLADFFSSSSPPGPSVHLLRSSSSRVFSSSASFLSVLSPTCYAGSFFFRRFVLLLPRAVSLFFAGFFFPRRQPDARTLSTAEALPLLQGLFSSKPSPEGSPSRLSEI